MAMWMSAITLAPATSCRTSEVEYPEHYGQPLRVAYHIHSWLPREVLVPIMAELQMMCEGAVSRSLMEHLKVDLLVPLIVAWALTTPPLELSQASVDEGSAAPDTAVTHSTGSIRHVAIGCLLRENARWDKCKEGDAHPQSNTRKKKSYECKGKKGGDDEEARLQKLKRTNGRGQVKRKDMYLFLSKGILFLTRSSSMGNKVDYIRGQPRKLPYQFLKDITNDFDEAQIVGRGAYGTVYKGICENGEEIAVKVVKNMTGFDNKEFHKEFENLRRLKHQNVVELLGFCKESEKVVVEYDGKTIIADKMHTALCFEYVRNGSLAKHISADGCSGLNWQILYKIIKGICQGLEYLRHGLEFPIWHLDLKPANILLDNNMIPKLADFGLSRLLGDENTRKTISSVGTG
ncbi:G-type lectin S-receptor-like serine/threonine-protein kinase SRK [Triticum urartu]|uniref:G-type lectin S-receptor-like serine/threonine-protein kinase SRK n=1 Tax=Triticum urartu TaxID=4572 RepID=M7YRJ5_TRIUA|nr:G-type lectin S-receptor-like serine/threonine-protein kinase SRK [Triticum urartu]